MAKENQAALWPDSFEAQSFLRKRAFKLPLRDALLKAHNFFDLYPLDGGGSLSFRSIAGEPDDAAITRKVMRRGLLKEWGSFPELDFSALERWRTVEKSCWLNRFYFIASMARTYWLTGDEVIARKVRDCVLHFIRHFPPPEGRDAIGEHIRYVYHIRDNDYNQRTYEENLADETDVRYVWFDFQPASRVLHLLYMLHFLRRSKSLSREDVAEINRAIYQHAETICIGEREFMELEKGDNHQSLRGLALLYAGTYFRGFGAWREFLRHGARICSFHIRKDFMSDGSLAENSPSYHCFETWHMRDAVLLSKQYGFKLCADADARLGRAVAFIHAMCQPDGYSPVISDGYPAHLAPFLETLPRVRRPKASAEALCFKDAGMGFYRDADRFLVFDASPFTGQFSHYHAGKNAVTLWYCGKPFLVDSGCPNYEDELFAKWYKKSEAHSSLLVDDRGDGSVIGTYNWSHWPEPRCGRWRETTGGLSISATLRSGAEGWAGVGWRRTVALRGDGGFELTDSVKSDRTVTASIVLNLHPDVRVLKRRDGLFLRNGSAVLRLDLDARTACGIGDGLCYVDYRHRKNRQVRLRLDCDGAAQATTVFTPVS